MAEFLVEIVCKDYWKTTATTHFFVSAASTAAAETAANDLATAFQLITDTLVFKVNLVVPCSGFTSAAATSTLYSSVEVKMSTVSQTMQSNSQVKSAIPGPKIALVTPGTNNPLNTGGLWATFIAAIAASPIVVTDKFGNTLTGVSTGFLDATKRKRIA